MICTLWPDAQYFRAANECSWSRCMSSCVCVYECVLKLKSKLFPSNVWHSITLRWKNIRFHFGSVVTAICKILIRDSWNSIHLHWILAFCWANIDSLSFSFAASLNFCESCKMLSFHSSIYFIEKFPERRSRNCRTLFGKIVWMLFVRWLSALLKIQII